MAAYFTPDELRSALWQRLKKRAEERLAVMRLKNDGDLPDAKTQRLRGRIAELKNLLALENPAPETEADDIE